MKRLNLVAMTKEDTKLLNILFEQNRVAYTEMIDDLSRKWKKNPYWWATCLASRDPLLSDAYKNICTVLLAIQRIEQDGDIREVTLPCEECKSVLLKYLEDKNSDIKVTASRRTKKFDDIEFIAQFSQNIRLKNCVNKLWKTPIAVKPGEDIVLADTEILASHLRKGIYQDRLFDNIEDLTDKKIVFLPQLINDIAADWNGLIKRIKKNRSHNTVLKEHFLQWRDYLKLLRIPFWNRIFCKGVKVFDGMDVTAIINGDLKTGMASAQTQESLLKYQLMKRMHKKIKIETLLGWYEGQPSSLGLFAAYNKTYRKGNSMGCIGVATDENLLSLMPSKEQIKQRTAPGQIGVIGEIFLNVPKLFCGTTKTLVFPAFRIKSEHVDCAKPMEDSVLIALSYAEFASRRILQMIKEIDGWLKANHIRVYIKNHPQLSKKTLRDYGIEELNCDYVFLDNSFSEAITYADIIITAQSTTSYETVMHGKRVILLGMTGDITYTFMPAEWKGKWYEVVYNTEELTGRILHFMETEAEHLNLSRAYLVRPSREELNKIL